MLGSKFRDVLLEKGRNFEISSKRLERLSSLAIFPRLYCNIGSGVSLTPFPGVSI